MTMRKRIVTLVALLILLAAASCVAIVWWTAPRNITTMERLAKLRGGETARQLEDALGSPGVDRPGFPPIPFGLINDPDRDLVGFLPFESKGLPIVEGWKEWQTPDGKRIAVCFDDSGSVAAAATFQVTESWFDEFHRWLRSP
jgi:hypothetical protein